MIINFIGCCIINLYESIKYILQGKVSFKNIIEQSVKVGYDSVPIALIISLLSGCVLSLQVSKQFVLTGAEAYIGGLLGLAMVREMAPVFASLAIGARAGTAITAEIANMQVTDQIDALKVLKVHPVAYLFVPRIIAGVIMVPVVTVLAELTGILGGMFVSKLTIGLNPNIYMTSVWLYLKPYDIKASIVKAAIFGLLISLICSTHGYLVKGGAKEVGIGTTKAAIWTAISILVFDYILTWVFY